MSAIDSTTTFKGADDENKGYKRSADVAYGAWRPKKEETQEETKKEFTNDLGVNISSNFFIYRVEIYKRKIL